MAPGHGRHPTDSPKQPNTSRTGSALATVVATGVGMLAALAVAAGVAWFVARRIAQPITQVAQATTRPATGDYAARVDPQRLGPELADLTDSVNTRPAGSRPPNRPASG